MSEDRKLWKMREQEHVLERRAIRADRDAWMTKALRTELKSTEHHLNAAYKAADHSCLSSEPLSCAIDRLKQRAEAADLSAEALAKAEAQNAKLREALKQANRQWKMYAEMSEDRDLMSDTDEEAQMWRKSIAVYREETP